MISGWGGSASSYISTQKNRGSDYPPLFITNLSCSIIISISSIELRRIISEKFFSGDIQGLSQFPNCADDGFLAISFNIHNSLTGNLRSSRQFTLRQSASSSPVSQSCFHTHLRQCTTVSNIIHYFQTKVKRKFDKATNWWYTNHSLIVLHCKDAGDVFSLYAIRSKRQAHLVCRYEQRCSKTIYATSQSLKRQPEKECMDCRAKECWDASNLRSLAVITFSRRGTTTRTILDKPLSQFGNATYQQRWNSGEIGTKRHGWSKKISKNQRALSSFDLAAPRRKTSYCTGSVTENTSQSRYSQEIAKNESTHRLHYCWLLESNGVLGGRLLSKERGLTQQITDICQFIVAYQLSDDWNPIDSWLIRATICIHYTDTFSRVSRGFVRFVAQVMDTEWVVREVVPMFTTIGISPQSAYPHEVNSSCAIFGVHGSEVAA